MKITPDVNYTSIKNQQNIESLVLITTRNQWSCRGIQYRRQVGHGEGAVAVGCPALHVAACALHSWHAARMAEMHLLSLNEKPRARTRSCLTGTWATADDTEMFAFPLQTINFSQFIIQRLKGEECSPGPSIISAVHSWERSMAAMWWASANQ